jgi:hypothetical protein
MNETSKGGICGKGTARHVWVAVAFFFAALLLLNGKGIYEGVGKQKYGARRDFLLRIVTPLKTLSEKTGLCALRDAAEDTGGSWLNGAE